MSAKPKKVRRVLKGMVYKKPIRQSKIGKSKVGKNKSGGRTFKSKKNPPVLDTMLKELTNLKTEVDSMPAALKKEKFSSPPVKVASMDLVQLSDEEVAVQLTRLYFEEIARLGFKRRLDFDAIINAYYYCLQRLQNRIKEMDAMRRIVEKEESKMAKEPKEELFPTME